MFSSNNTASERTEVFIGDENTTRVVLRVLSDLRYKCESCTDSTGPSVAIEVFKKAMEYARNRGISFRYLTEITPSNLSYCKQLSKLTNLRHLEGIKGNFSVFDDRVYLASATLKEAQPVSQLIYSNVRTLVEQQKYLFETLWTRAIPAEIRIREVEEGITLGTTEVIQVPSRIQELFINLVKSAKEEVFLVLPTINAFYREERLGIIRLLKEAALDRNINIRILTPTNDDIEKRMIVLEQGQKLDVRPIETTTGATVTTVTILVADRKESLAIEKIDDSKDNFLEATGSATYSNSQPTVLSYLSIFESLWQQTKLYLHVKEANTQLEYANEQLLATEKAKEEFISMISHELKTPLVPLKGYAQMLLRPKFMGGTEVNERQKNAIEAMSRNIEKLQTLVEDVMDVYKLDMGKLKFSMTDTDITKLVDETVSELKSLTLDKNIDLKADVKANGTVFCDPNRIEQVLTNLIKNSIDFVPDNGSGKITVRVQRGDSKASDNNSNMTLFTVEDNGIGIDPEKADKLFQKFYQIDTGPTRKHAGTGLGLVICRGIINAHGGKIWLDKAYRGGASIRFTLPQRGKQAKMEGIQA
jgi:signal transduction histidine kinase